MAGGSGSVVRGLLLPAPARRGPGDLRPLLVREWQRCMRPAALMGVLLFALAFAIGTMAPTSVFLVLCIAGLGASWLTVAVVARALARQRLNPANRVIAATMLSLAGRWRDFDGGGIPKDGAEGLARAGERTDDRATSLRVWSLMNGWARLDEAAALLRAWTPVEPSAVAYRLRCLVILDRDPSLRVSPHDIERAIAAITDPADALAARLSFALEQAVRLDAAGSDPFPPILAVAPLVGEINVRKVMRDLR